MKTMGKSRRPRPGNVRANERETHGMTLIPASSFDMLFKKRRSHTGEQCEEEVGCPAVGLLTVDAKGDSCRAQGLSGVIKGFCLHIHYAWHFNRIIE